MQTCKAPSAVWRTIVQSSQSCTLSFFISGFFCERPTAPRPKGFCQPSAIAPPPSFPRGRSLLQPTKARRCLTTWPWRFSLARSSGRRPHRSFRSKRAPPRHNVCRVSRKPSRAASCTGREPVPGSRRLGSAPL